MDAYSNQHKLTTTTASTMADVARMEAAYIQAVAPSLIARYKEYETSDNFLRWLSGLEVRIREAYRFEIDEKDELKEEVCRSIPGMLSVGSALDAYNRLTHAEQTDYGLLVSRLTEEFTDKDERYRFRDNIGYNKRKKGQKLIEFAQEIKDDMNRYSSLPDKITQNGTEIANPEKVRESVRRFRSGMRNTKGKKDKDLTRHLLFHLMEDSDLTWEKAITIAERWETSSNIDPPSSSPEPASSSYDDTNLAGAVLGEIESDENLVLLAEQIKSNSARIREIEISQNVLIAEVEEIKTNMERQSDYFQLIADKLDTLFLPTDDDKSA